MSTALDMRQAAHPRDVRHYDSAALRADFLIETLFARDQVQLTHSHLERMIIGGAMPGASPLPLAPYRPTGTPDFLDRREIGIFNIGGAGMVLANAQSYPLDRLDALYLPPGSKDVRFTSLNAANPAKFYLLSVPGTRQTEAKLLRQREAKRLDLGSPETSNQRSIFQYFVPSLCDTNQLVMGVTQLAPGSVWNTMPTHVHDRRSEAYLYFDLGAEARVFHLMGEANETRHLVVANEQAVLSPNWSIHSGCGTAHYSFIWGMGGENVEFADMDAVAMAELR
jgi:4-deoxy-L-threo-5-hexosulose-uronate ketol-isomerase